LAVVVDASNRSDADIDRFERLEDGDLGETAVEVSTGDVPDARMQARNPGVAVQRCKGTGVTRSALADD